MACTAPGPFWQWRNACPRTVLLSGSCKHPPALLHCPTHGRLSDSLPRLSCYAGARVFVCRVTKTCLFLLLLPMAWRMVDKAHSLFRHETAAKKATAQSFEPEDLPTAAAATVAQLQPGAHLPAAATGAGPAVPDAAEDAPAADAGSTSSCSAVDASAAVQQTGGQGEPSAAPPADIESGCAGKAALQLPQQQPCSLSGGPGLSKGQQVQMGCWQLPSKDPEWSCRTDPATCETVRHKLEREQAQMLPPFQCGLLVLLLADVAVASLLAGYLVGTNTSGVAVSIGCPLQTLERHHLTAAAMCMCLRAVPQAALDA